LRAGIIFALTELVVMAGPIDLDLLFGIASYQVILFVPVRIGFDSLVGIFKM
jgi:hypothetical protein